MIQIKVIKESEELTHIALSGMLDVAGVQEIEEQFQQIVAERGKPTLIDMSNVTFIASMGISLLFSNAKLLSRTDAKMVLLKAQPMVQKVLKIVGLDRIVLLENSETKAFDLLKPDKSE